MKKKNGFTLVELLAVIVVLALIMIIAIPSVLTTMNKSRKESFFLYAQNLQQKAISQYTNDLTVDNTADINCMTYGIHTTVVDGEETCESNRCLDFSDNGNYDGWVQVERVAVDGGDKRYSITLQHSDPKTRIGYIYYCVDKVKDGAVSCEPNQSYRVDNDNSKDKNGNYNYPFSVDIPKPLKDGTEYGVKYYYKYETADSKLASSSVVTVKYSDSNSNLVAAGETDYKYNVIMSLRSDNYAVEYFNMESADGSVNTSTEEESSNKNNKEVTETKERFYAAIDEYSKKYSGTDFGVLDGPTCSGEAANHLNAKNATNCPENTNKDFTIKLDTLGGVVNGDTTITATVNESGKYVAGNLPDASKNKATFEGWYLDKNYGVKVTNGSAIEVKAKTKSGCAIGYQDVTLYAKWKADENATQGQTITSQVRITSVSDTYYAITRQNGEVIKTGAVERTTVDLTDNTILLESLDVSGYQLQFSPLDFEYSIKVPNEVQNVNVVGVPKVAETLVSVTGAENLEVGQNNVVVTLYNPDNGHMSNYVIKVSRLNEIGEEVQKTRVVNYEVRNEDAPDPLLESSNASLTNIQISGYTLGFNKNVYDYTLEISEDDEELVIITKTAVPNARAYIGGNEHLTDGSVIDIAVTSQNGYYVKHYKINIRKPHQETQSTKILKGVVVGLIVLLIGCVTIIKISKSKKLRALDEDINDIIQTDNTGENYVDNSAQTTTNNVVPQTLIAESAQTSSEPVQVETPESVSDTSSVNENFTSSSDEAVEPAGVIPVEKQPMDDTPAIDE